MYEITYLDKRPRVNFGNPDNLYETLRYIAKKHPAALVPFLTLQFTNIPGDSAYAAALETKAATKARTYPTIGWFGIRRIGTGDVYNDIDTENRQDCAIVLDRLERLEKIADPRPDYIAEYFIHHPKVYADQNIFSFLIP